MNKALLICLCVIMLIGAGIIGLTTFSSKAQAPAGGIIIEDADYVANKTTEYSADLINIAENVTPRIVVEYGDSISKLDLYKSDDLNQAASTVTPRIIVEYADFMTELGLQGSQDLIQTTDVVTPRIIVEYADSIFRADLERPLFGAEVSARIDSYSISPRNVAVGDSVTIGFSFTNTGNVSWAFGAGATLRKPDGTRVDFFEAVTVNPGESRSAQWTHTIDMAGRWDTVFGVWKESTHPLKNLLVQTGWVPEYITAVAVENQPPIANIEPDLLYEISSGKSVFFNGSNSEDPDGTIISYLWDFGDGETAEGCIVEHRFRGAMDQSKTYTVTLTVEDERESTGTDTTYVTVRPLEKTIEIGGETLLHPGFARMTAYYNWIGITEIDGQPEDIYIVSKIHFEGQRYISYVLSIWDSYSFSVGIPAWSRGLVYFGQPVERDFVYPFGTRRDKTYTFDDGYFEGMAVGPSDVMKLWGFNVKIISGVAGPIYEGASTSFDPGSITEPEEEVPNLEFVHLASPGELRVYDSQGRVTGLVNGEIKEEIPYSVYNNNTVLISFLFDSYRYEIAGTGEGSYDLTVTSIAEQETNNFTATGIPTSPNAIHQYTIDWAAVSQGEEGVTVKVDSDGNGTFEKTFTSDSELTQDEFMLQLPPGEAFPMWMVGVAVATIAIATVAIAVFWRRRKQPATKR